MEKRDLYQELRTKGLTSDQCSEISDWAEQYANERVGEGVICIDCKKPISEEKIHKGLFMRIEGGGLIHWNCKEL